MSEERVSVSEGSKESQLYRPRTKAAILVFTWIPALYSTEGVTVCNGTTLHEKKWGAKEKEIGPGKWTGSLIDLGILSATELT